MTPDRRKEINTEVARLETDLEKREASAKATRQVIETFVADCEALFVTHQSGQRVLEFLEQYFCAEPTTDLLLRLSAEDASKHVARCKGNREVVQFLRAAAVGALKVADRAA